MEKAASGVARGQGLHIGELLVLALPSSPIASIPPPLPAFIMVRANVFIVIYCLHGSPFSRPPSVLLDLSLRSPVVSLSAGSALEIEDAYRAITSDVNY